jgi:hypothetical protein
MRTSTFLVLLFVLIVCIGFRIKSSASSVTPADRSFRELVSQRERLDGKRVSVIGYLDAKNMLLIASLQSTRDPIAIDLTPAQRRGFKRLLRAGYVRIAGKFEYVGSQRAIGPIKGDPEHRMLVLSPAGFGTGGYTMRLTNITEINAVSPPRPPVN